MGDQQVRGEPVVDGDVGTPAVPAPAAGEAAELWRNQTPSRLTLRAENGAEVTFPSLGARLLSDTEARWWRLEELARRGLVARERPVEREADLSWVGGVLAAGTFGLFMGWLAISTPAEGAGPGPFEPAITPQLYWGAGGAVLVVLVAVLAALAALGRYAVGRAVAQMLSLFGVVAVGFGLPAGYALLLSSEGAPADEPMVFAVGLQVLFLGVASTLPSLLYFLFDRQRLGTVRERFRRHVFRLDPDVETLADLEAKYGRQMEEAFGHIADDVVRLHRQKRWPIMLATLVLTIGWIVTLPPDGMPAADGAELYDLLEPEYDLLPFGFLGAYFFALHTVARRYVRADLRPKTYGSIAVRVLVAVVLAWLLDVYDLGVGSLLAVFVVAIVPETYVTYLQAVLRSGLADRIAPRLAEKHPLDRLDGIDLYDRARLQDEGVTNVESLAHHDLVDLLLETRIPAARLVDWVDQAILYLHAVGDDGAGETDGRGSWRSHLRGCGVRTATDLVAVVHPHLDRPDLLQRLVPDALGEPYPEQQPPQVPAALQILLASLADDEWLEQVRHWRRQNREPRRTISLGAGRSVRDERTDAADPRVAVPA